MQVYRGGRYMTVNILVLHGMNQPGRNEVVTKKFKQLLNGTNVTYYLAFLEGATNTLKQVVELLIKEGLYNFNIIPILLFPAKHYFEDIPNTLKDIKAHHPTLNYKIAKPLGTHRYITKIIKNKITNTLKKCNEIESVVLLAHGSSMYTEPQQALHHLAQACDEYDVPIQTMLLYGEDNYTEQLGKVLNKYPNTLIVPVFLWDGFLVQKTKQFIRRQAFSDYITFCSAINFIPDLAIVIKDRINEVEVLTNVYHAS